MKLLGLDVSSRSTGYALLDGSGQLMKHGLIKPHKKLDLAQKLGGMFRD